MILDNGLRVRARRAYELGRLRRSVRTATLVGAAVALLAYGLTSNVALSSVSGGCAFLVAALGGWCGEARFRPKVMVASSTLIFAFAALLAVLPVPFGCGA